MENMFPEDPYLVGTVVGTSKDPNMVGAIKRLVLMVLSNIMLSNTLDLAQIVNIKAPLLEKMNKMTSEQHCNLLLQ